jgi:hypothetical protein
VRTGWVRGHASGRARAWDARRVTRSGLRLLCAIGRCAGLRAALSVRYLHKIWRCRVLRHLCLRCCAHAARHKPCRCCHIGAACGR